MSATTFFVLVILCWEVSVQGQTSDLRYDGGSTSNKEIYLDNYIPAAMQVMFYLTDLMKYEIKPAAPGPTTTTIRPTPPHKPGNYAPAVPLGAAYYFAKSSARSSWAPPPGVPGEGLHSGYDSGREDEPVLPRMLPDDLDLLGAGPSDLLHQINSLGDFDVVGEDDDDHILKFSINYEDNVNLDFLRQKRVPPTRAYVTLLSLYDLLNKEAKEKGLNKYNGYAERILKELAKTSDGSAGDQLKFVLSKIMEKKNTRRANTVKKIKQMLEDLEKPESYISDALQYIQPLQFSL